VQNVSGKRKTVSEENIIIFMDLLLFYLDKLSATFCVRKVPTTESIKDPPHGENFLGPDKKE
jgi:hypothetical protein